MTLRHALHAVVLTIAIVGVAGLAGCESTHSHDHGSEKTMSYDKPGYKTFVEDGRLWVFAEGSDGLKSYLASGEPAKSVTVLGKGPGGMTIKSVDKETIDAYLAAK